MGRVKRAGSIQLNFTRSFWSTFARHIPANIGRLSRDKSLLTCSIAVRCPRDTRKRHSWLDCRQTLQKESRPALPPRADCIPVSAIDGDFVAHARLFFSILIIRPTRGRAELPRL